MKRILVFALCVIGFMLIAAPTPVEYHQVFVNGKPFAKAGLVNGIIAVRVRDLATAAGDTVALEHFKLNGGTLTTVSDVTSQAMKVKDASPTGKDAGSPAQKVREAALVLGNGSRVSAEDTVPFALWCAARFFDDYETALWSTVSAGGDMDTNCAIVGGIVAISAQARGIPSEWLTAREALPRLLRRSLATAGTARR